MTMTDGNDVVLADLIEASVRKALTDHFTAQQAEIDTLKQRVSRLENDLYKSKLSFEWFC